MGCGEGEDVLVEREEVAEVRGEDVVVAVVRVGVDGELAGGFEEGDTEVVACTKYHDVDVVCT